MADVTGEALRRMLVSALQGSMATGAGAQMRERVGDVPSTDELGGHLGVISPEGQDYVDYLMKTYGIEDRRVAENMYWNAVREGAPTNRPVPAPIGGSPLTQPKPPEPGDPKWWPRFKDRWFGTPRDNPGYGNLEYQKVKKHIPGG